METKAHFGIFSFIHSSLKGVETDKKKYSLSHVKVATLN